VLQWACKASLEAVTEDFIQQFQDDQYYALLSDAELAGVSIFRRRTPLPKDESGNPVVGDTVAIEDQLNQVLGGIAQRNGQAGAAIVVMLPDVAVESAQNMTLPIKLKWKLRIVENQIFNESAGGTGLPSSRLALHVAQFMQTRSFRGGNPLRCDPAKAIEEISLPGFLVHEVNGECSIWIGQRDKCAAPVPAQENGMITLSCSTSGARIYYTLDQSYPGSGNEGALLYAEPIQLDPGTYLLRMAAEADGKQSSNDLAAQVTVSP
jgi:hypothetical protein